MKSVTMTQVYSTTGFATCSSRLADHHMIGSIGMNVGRHRDPCLYRLGPVPVVELIWLGLAVSPEGEDWAVIKFKLVGQCSLHQDNGIKQNSVIDTGNP